MHSPVRLWCLHGLESLSGTLSCGSFSDSSFLGSLCSAEGLGGAAQLSLLACLRHVAVGILQVRFMGLAFGGKELVFEEDPNLNLRKVHYHLIRDKGLTLVSSYSPSTVATPALHLPKHGST